MSDLFGLIWCALIGLFRPRAALEAEILVLRHQLNVLRRKSPKRLALGNIDRLVFARLNRVAPGILDALKILKPQTVIRWHRAGFRTYWRWKFRTCGGRSSSSGFERWVYGISRSRHGWQNGYSERLIGSIRRDCLDHVVVFGERHLRHLLNSYQKYYNEARTHLSLHKDAPIPRAVQTVGRTLAMPVLGGLHHQYFRA
jgi:Integrase core domain